MFKGFKEFLLRGNVVDLAVAVVIGAAFNAVIQKFVDAIINPIVGVFFNAESLDGALKIGLPGGGELAIGMLIGALINFIIIAAVVYFVFVLPMNKLRKPEPEPEPAGPSEADLLVEIRDLLAKGNTSGAAAAASQADDGETPRHA